MDLTPYLPAIKIVAAVTAAGFGFLGILSQKTTSPDGKLNRHGKRMTAGLILSTLVALAAVVGETEDKRREDGAARERFEHLVDSASANLSHLKILQERSARLSASLYLLDSASRVQNAEAARRDQASRAQLVHLIRGTERVANRLLTVDSATTQTVAVLRRSTRQQEAMLARQQMVAFDAARGLYPLADPTIYIDLTYPLEHPHLEGFVDTLHSHAARVLRLLSRLETPPGMVEGVYFMVRDGSIIAIAREKDWILYFGSDSGDPDKPLALDSASLSGPNGLNGFSENHYYLLGERMFTLQFHIRGRRLRLPHGPGAELGLGYPSFLIDGHVSIDEESESGVAGYVGLRVNLRAGTVRQITMASGFSRYDPHEMRSLLDLPGKLLVFSAQNLGDAVLRPTLNGVRFVFGDGRGRQVEIPSERWSIGECTAPCYTAELKVSDIEIEPGEFQQYFATGSTTRR